MIRALGPLFGCGLMMVVCMVAMAAMGRRRSETTDASTTDEEVSRLRAELDALRRDTSADETHK